jgi:hypothetical protein
MRFARAAADLAHLLSSVPVDPGDRDLDQDGDIPVERGADRLGHVVGALGAPGVDAETARQAGIEQFTAWRADDAPR